MFDSSLCSSGLGREEDFWCEEERCLPLEDGPLRREVAVLMVSSFLSSLVFGAGVISKESSGLNLEF